MAPIYPENPLWVCCCCGCYPFIGILKGLLAAIPCTLIFMVMCIGMSIIMWPYDIILAYYGFIATQKILYFYGFD